MNIEYFSQNLRRLRTGKALTQEQLGELLGVSVQSVSRWECGNSLPDVMLLPRIARLYGVTVDDLYRAEPKAYPSYAQRLLAVYEASGKTEDFLAAEQEFARIPAKELSADDLRAWGVLYHYMVKHSAHKAQQKLEQAMAAPDAADRVLSSAAQQKIALMCDLGKGMEEAARYDRALAGDPADERLWLLCTAAHEFAGDYPRALELALEGIKKYPGNASLRVHAGDICRGLKLYDEAFAHWHQALELDRSFLDAVYSMGFCHEELGQYEDAYRVWTALSEELDRRGLTIERKFPAELADACRKRMA